MDDVLTSSFEALVAKECDLARVRRIEAGESPAGLWAQLEELGFIEALVPEDRGGVGLSVREITDLTITCGRHVLPLPLAQTMFARAELADAGPDIPRGAITLADRARFEGNEIAADGVPFGMTAEWVWLSAGTQDWLLPVSGAERAVSAAPGSLAADLRWLTVPKEAVRLDNRSPDERDLRAAGAALTAALLAGAIERAVEMSIAYANERVQFGKPIGKQQAIQQQLSVMCELMYAARTAAAVGLCGDHHRIDRLRAATAKSRTSEAALTVANMCHAVHGAIGITAEYDLQMFTRRLHEWRQAYGSETYWNGVLGNALLGTEQSPLEFVREHLAGC